MKEQFLYLHVLPDEGEDKPVRDEKQIMKEEFLYLHVLPDEGEDEAPVHDREQIMEEEGEACVQLLHLLPLLHKIYLFHPPLFDKLIPAPSIQID